MPPTLLALLTIPLATALACWVTGRSAWLVRIHYSGAAGTLVAGLALAAEVISSGPLMAAGGFFALDALSALLIAVIVTVCFLAALYSVGYLQHDIASDRFPAERLNSYYAGFHFFLWIMLLTPVVNNLGLLWISIEATTIISTLLVGFYRTEAALEAAWKYLILCSVGIMFALFGVLLTYYAAVHAVGEEAGLDWTILVAEAPRLDPGVMKLAFVFAVVGLGTKAGFAPLHTWLPDAYSQAPSPISAILSGALSNCALYAILRFHRITAGTLGPDFSSTLLLGFGLTSVAFAVPFLLRQSDVKRLLAYSSVEHMGLVAIAIGVGGPLGIYAGMLHMVNHALTKALLFFVAGELLQQYGTRRISAIRGALAALPLAGPLLLVGAFAITGMPPFGMFLSELGIVSAGFGQGYGWATAALLALLALGFAGIFGQVAGMAFGRSAPLTSVHKVDGVRWLALVLPALGIGVLGVYVPPPLASAMGQAAALLTMGGR
ncbi:MAG: hydrogenase 4 subunit F [Chloroflexi bacterium]|nr:hydrogenase 4 subunit F [Chloroflexota bacterium]